MLKFTILLFAFFPFILIAQNEPNDNSNVILDGSCFIFKGNTGTYGIKSSNDSTVLVLAQYAHINEIPEGIIIVKQNKNTSYERSYSSGFLNKSLKMILPCKYRNITSSGNGHLIACQNSDFKYGLVDTVGRILIPFIYDDLETYGDGLFPAKMGESYGYLNGSGKTVIPFTFQFAQPFSEGKAAAKRNSKFGYIDKRGHFIIPETFTSASNFKHGFAMVSIFEMSTLIDEKGEILFPYLFESIEPLSSEIFLFKAPEMYRDTLDSIVKRDANWIKNSAFNYTNPNKTIESDTLVPFEFESNAEFQGLISPLGNLIGGNHFKTVQFLGEKNGKMFFSVQSKVEIDEKDNWNFAVMNEDGQILTPYEYFDIRMEDDTIIGEKEEEDLQNVFYKISSTGTATRLKD